jgi:uncharacterized protein YjdB
MPSSFLSARRSRRLLSTALLAGSLTALGACDDDPTVPASRVAVVNVSERINAIPVGGTVQLTATAATLTGDPVTGGAVTWTSVNPSIATVSPTGLVTGVARGTTAITATIDGRSASASVEVLAPIATITIEGSVGTVPVGTSRQLRAIATDAAGNFAPGRALTWTSSNQAVATVSSSGLLTALTEGTTTITATAEGRTGTLPVTAAILAASIELAPTDGILAEATRQLTAIVRDGQGNPITRPVTWTTSNSAVVGVSQTGLVTRGDPGSATITARHENLSAAFTLWVPFAGSTRLMHNTPITIAGAQGSFVLYYAYVPPGSTSFSVQMSGGTGDADIYVYPPGASNANCSPFVNGNNETCNYTGAQVIPGMWVIGVDGYTAYAGASLRVVIVPNP